MTIFLSLIAALPTVGGGLFAEDSAIPGAMFAAGLLLLTFWLLMRFTRRSRALRKRQNASEAKRPQADATRMRDRDELNAVSVQAQEITRECAAMIENRIARLETVLAIVDERLAEYERIMDDEPRRLSDAPSSPPPSTVARASRQDARRDPGAHRLRLKLDGRDASDDPAPHAAAATDDDPLTRRVCALADAGRTPIEIAQQLGEPTGKVELILALRQASV